MRRLARLLVVLTILLAVAAGAFAGAMAWLTDRLDAPGPLSVATTVTVPPGSSVFEIGGALERSGAIADRFIFVVAERAYPQRRALKAGEYAIPAGASLATVLDMLRDGRTLEYRLTVPEGLNVRQIAALVERHEALAGPMPPLPAEGSLLPETYTFPRGYKRADLIRRMGAAMQKAVAEAWPKAQAAGLPLRSAGELVTLASIVEKETALPAERPRVAGVYLNRLRQGMRLQADPTTVYALTKGQAPLGRPLTYADLALQDPYNTYAVAGLPPGPIACPGVASLQAAAAPEQHRFLFFVADGSGGHVFAQSAAEHERNVQAWRRVQRQISQP